MNETDKLANELKTIKKLTAIMTGCIVFMVILIAVIVLPRILGQDKGEQKPPPTFYQDKIEASLNKEQYAEALSWADEFILHFPGNEQAYWNKGVIHYRNEKWRDAIEAFRKALKLDPALSKEWIKPYLEIAEKELMQGQIKE